MADDPLSLLLGEVPLEGTVGVTRLLGPPRSVAAIANDAEHAAEAVASRCELWGGVADLLVPATAEGALPTFGLWADLIAEAMPDRYDGFGVDEALLPERKYRHFSIAEPLPVILASLDREPSELRAAAIPELGRDDPWWVSYQAIVGWLPVAPANPNRLQMSRLDLQVRYEDLIPIERTPVEGSGPDLLSRLRDHRLTPLALTLTLLGVPRLMSGPFATESPWVARRHQTLSRLGPNVVVIYEPGSIEDLCLVWALRAATGWPRGFPLAVPNVGQVSDVIRAWDQESARMWTNLSGPGAAGLTSLSVPHESLDRLAADLGEGWSRVDAIDLMSVGGPPSRSSTDIAHFKNGRATIAAWGASDIQQLGNHVSQYESLGMTARFHPVGRQLPPYKSLAARQMVGAYANGSYEIGAGRAEELSEIRWPSGWTVIEAFARDRGLVAKASSPGRAAEALAHRMGGLDKLQLLASREIIDTLYRLCERSGMTWFRDRLNGLLKTISATPGSERTAEIEAYLAELVETQDDADLRSLAPSAFTLSGSRYQREEWFAWAEEAGVLVRGADVECRTCKAKSWRPAAELAPTMTCRACGDPITRPFRHDVLNFRYRASEPVRRVLEHDALGHLLTLLWMTQLFRGERLYGGHPGVEFYDGDKCVGEADVLLLFVDGTAAVGEYKRAGAGLKEDELDKLDVLAAALDADWSFVATHEDSTNCPDLWKHCQRALPERPRFAICGERLATFPLRISGTNPLAWPEGTEEGFAVDTSPGSAAEWMSQLARSDYELHAAWRLETSRAKSEGGEVRSETTPQGDNSEGAP